MSVFCVCLLCVVSVCVSVWCMCLVCVSYPFKMCFIPLCVSAKRLGKLSKCIYKVLGISVFSEYFLYDPFIARALCSWAWEPWFKKRQEFWMSVPDNTDTLLPSSVKVLSKSFWDLHSLLSMTQIRDIALCQSHMLCSLCFFSSHFYIRNRIK